MQSAASLKVYVVLRVLTGLYPHLSIFGFRKPEYTKSMELYHVLNRGVEKRDIFMDEKDHLRFVHDLWEFNDENLTPRVHHSFIKSLKNSGLRNPNFEPKGKRIVDIHGWCLVKNHYHLLLSERIDGGLTLFLRKLNVGYANYFNEKHKRVGSLFQGRTKKIHVNSDAYFLHILNYVHLNPLDYMTSAYGWRERRLEKPKQAHEYLLKYRWSSYPDYCGKRNFPSLITRDLFGEKSEKFERRIFDYSGTRHEELPVQFLLE